MANLGEKVWFRKIWENGASSFASCMTQGIFVCHLDRRGAVLCFTRYGVVRGKKLDETDTEHRTLRTGTACVARRGKWWLLN